MSNCNLLSIYTNGKLYHNFTSYEFLDSLANASGEFAFKATNTVGQEFPFSKGDACEIFIDNNKVMSGFLNMVGGTSDPETHEIRIAGRSKIQDVIDSSIKGNLDFKNSTDILTVFRKVFTLNGITGINVKLQDGLTIRRFSQKELISAKTGDNAFDFLASYCRIRQVLITSDENGDIILTRAGSEKYETILLKEKEGEENNILRSDFEDNDSSRFNEYIVLSQSNPIAQKFDVNYVGKQNSPVVDSNIRTGRVLVVNTEITSDVQTNTDRAKWESNIRRTKGFQYNCRIRNYYLDAKSKVLIKSNRIIQVIDDTFGINSELLIKSCRYIKSPEGTFTDINLVNKDAFTLEEQQKGIESRFNTKDDIFPRLGS